MKSHKMIIAILLILLNTIVIQPVVNAQQAKKDKQASRIVFTKNMIDSQNFIFVPQSILPMRGSSRHLTSSYELVVSKDTLISYLPFFGRAYTAPLLPGDNGFDFTSTNFEYKINNDKKGGWDITIKPKDQVNVQQFSLRIFDNGSASLNITSLNREPISYTGYITGKK